MRPDRPPERPHRLFLGAVRRERLSHVERVLALWGLLLPLRASFPAFPAPAASAAAAAAVVSEHAPVGHVPQPLVQLDSPLVRRAHEKVDEAAAGGLGPALELGDERLCEPGPARRGGDGERGDVAVPALPLSLDFAEDVAEDGAAARGFFLVYPAAAAACARSGLGGSGIGGGGSGVTVAVARAWPLSFSSSSSFCLFLLFLFLLFFFFLDGREAQLGPPREVGQVEAEVVLLVFFGFGFFFLVGF